MQIFFTFINIQNDICTVSEKINDYDCTHLFNESILANSDVRYYNFWDLWNKKIRNSNDSFFVQSPRKW